VLKSAAIHSCWNFSNKVRYNQSMNDALVFSLTGILLMLLYSSLGQAIRS
jgi:hypothetical protein